MRPSQSLLLLVGLLLFGGYQVGCNGGFQGNPPTERAGFHIHYYDVEVAVDPAERHITGRSTAHGIADDSLSAVTLNLAEDMQVDSVFSNSTALEYRHHPPEIVVEKAVPAGQDFTVSIAYSGTPREAPNPPWQGGFTWSEAPGREPWVGTSNQLEGASLWWAALDHPSQRPDSLSMALTVPDTLVGLSNGHLRDRSQSDGWETSQWHVSHPIHTYAVAINIGPYVRNDREHTAHDGSEQELTFWALPADSDRAEQHLDELSEMVQFMEETVGPYAFWQDKLAVAQAPFLGMEHQTLLAYGSHFEDGGLGYDASFDVLLFHELAHEWFGNAVGVRDWHHLWLNEGFATYWEALYARERDGEEAYRELIDYFRGEYTGGVVAPIEAVPLEEIYGRDLYFGGAIALHELSEIVGEERLLDLVSSWYDERRYSLVETADYLELVRSSTSETECRLWRDQISAMISYEAVLCS